METVGVKISKLERHEIDSPLWQRLKAHLEEEIRIQRTKNDGDHDAIRTADIRGRIAQLKALLALGNLDPAQVADDGK